MSKFIEGALRCFSIQALQATGEHIPKTHPLYRELEADLTEATRTPPKFPMSEWSRIQSPRDGCLDSSISYLRLQHHHGLYKVWIDRVCDA